MRQSRSELPERSIVGLLNETFELFGSNFWRFVVITAVIQAPLSAASFIFGTDTSGQVIENGLRVFGSVFVYGAIVYAVGQRYVTGAIEPARAYRRVLWKIVSTVLLGLMLTGSFTIIMLPVLMPDTFANSVGLAFAFLFLLIGLSILLVYWSMGIQAVLVENRRIVAALARSFQLIKGSWWRIVGINLAFGLVGVGLSIIAGLPFALVSLLLASEEPTLIVEIIRFIQGLVVSIVVPPVIFISGTLIYYDLRVRKENYSIDALAQDMGFVKA